MRRHPSEGILIDQKIMSRWDLMFASWFLGGVLGLGVIAISTYGFGESLSRPEVAGRIFLAGIASFVPAVAATGSS